MTAKRLRRIARKAQDRAYRIAPEEWGDNAWVCDARADTAMVKGARLITRALAVEAGTPWMVQP